MQLELSRQLFYCDDVKGGFDKDRNIGDVICGIKMLKQNMQERTWKYQKKPREDEQKPLKNSGWILYARPREKSLHKNQTKSTK